MLVMPTERDAEAWSKDRFSPMARDTPCLVGQDLRPEVARRLEQDPAQALPGRAPDHRRRQRALGAREPADPHPALRRGRPLPVQRRRRGRPGQPREEAHGHLLEPQDRAGLDADDPRREPDRDRLCRERPAAVLGAVPELRRPSGAGLEPGPLGQRRRRAPAGDGPLPLRRLRRGLVGRAALELRSAAASGGRGRRSRGIAGFHLNEVYSSWVRLEAMVRAFLSARAGGDEAMKTFVNTSLGESWMEFGRGAGLAPALRPPRALASGHRPRGRADPDRRGRRAEGPHRGRRLGLGPRAGELARRSRRHRGRAGERGRLVGARGTARPDLAACPRGRSADRAARRRHRLRGAGGLCVGTGAGVRAGGAGQGRRGLQPGEPGVGADLCRCDRRRQAAAPRRPALDGGGLDLQGGDLPLPQARAADGRGPRRWREHSARHDPPAGLGRDRSG